MSTVPLANLSLFLATAEQIDQSTKQAAQEWANGQPLEHYIKRWELLRSKEHSKQGRYQQWVLAPRSDPTTLDFMCSCKTYRRTAIVARDETISEATTYYVAACHTPLENRRKGYAQHMMRLLHWVLAPRSSLPLHFPSAWNAPPQVDASWKAGSAQFSILYSEIGDMFYHACGPDAEPSGGWSKWRSIETTLDLSSGYDLPSLSLGSYQWKWLTVEDVRQVHARDSQWIKDELSAASQTSDKTLFSLLPDNGVAELSMDKTMEFTTDGRPVFPLDTWGVIVLLHAESTLADALSADLASAPAFATWTLDILAASRTLSVTRLRASSLTFPAVLNKVAAFARENSCQKIDIWDLPEEFQAMSSALGWTTGERRAGLSSLKWYGDEAEDQLEWRFNEQFCK